MITFNDILRIEGIDPRQVRLVRHQDKSLRRARRRDKTVPPSLYEAWIRDPGLLERYQAVQARDVFNVGEILASFVATPRPRRETLFVGLYLVEAVGRASQRARDPITGDDVGGQVQYSIARIDKLSEY